MTGVFFLYDVAAALVAGIVLRPIVRLRLAWGRATDTEVRERLGRIAPPHSARRPRIVLHGVSAGEMAAAGAVAEAIAARLPDAGFFLTAGNADGRAAGERLRERLPGAMAPGFLPWDRRKFVERWLAAADPDAVAVVETEIWPNLFRACGRAGVPLFVVNGRVPDGDFGRYRLGRFFFRPVLANVRTILARSAEDARRFVAIGAAAARVRDVGNVKFDAAATQFRAAAEESATLPSGEASLRLVAGSTHAPEERLLIEAAGALRADFPGLSLVIAPRRVRRARAILRRARAAGFRAALASEGDPAAEIHVLDAIGGLADAYSDAAIAVVGGSFSRGSHSPLEAAARGCALVLGPRPGAFRDDVRDLVAAGAARRVCRRQELVPVLRALLSDPVRRQALGRRARAYAESGRGAAARCADEIIDALRQRGAVSVREAPAASPRSGSADRGR